MPLEHAVVSWVRISNVAVLTYRTPTLGRDTRLRRDQTSVLAGRETLTPIDRRIRRGVRGRVSLCSYDPGQRQRVGENLYKALRATDMVVPNLDRRNVVFSKAVRRGSTHPTQLD